MMDEATANDAKHALESSESNERPGIIDRLKAAVGDFFASPANDTEPMAEPEPIDVVAEYVNNRLNEDATFFEEGEPLVEVEGEPLTRDDVDEALSEVRAEVDDE